MAEAPNVTRIGRATAPRSGPRAEQVNVLAVASGKGGVGKTNVSVNLALAMAQRGREVLLLDADLGLANVDVLLGLHPRFNLSHVLIGDCSLEEVLIRAAPGLRVIPAASGIQRMADLSQREHAGIIHSFGQLAFTVDTMIVDMAAGISEMVITFTRACQEVIVVVCDEPASITDAYALIKVLSQDSRQTRFHVLANMTRSVADGRELFARLAKVTTRFLDVTLDYLGTIPYDEYLRRAVQKQKAVVEAYPSSRAAYAFRKLAVDADRWSAGTDGAGGLQFFLERLVRPQPVSTETRWRS
jgi:flagellar biosynthesis protein FlhG